MWLNYISVIPSIHSYSTFPLTQQHFLIKFPHNSASKLVLTPASVSPVKANCTYTAPGFPLPPFLGVHHCQEDLYLPGKKKKKPESWCQLTKQIRCNLMSTWQIKPALTQQKGGVGVNKGQHLATGRRGGHIVSPRNALLLCVTESDHALSPLQTLPTVPN